MKNNPFKKYFVWLFWKAIFVICSSLELAVDFRKPFSLSQPWTLVSAHGCWKPLKVSLAVRQLSPFRVGGSATAGLLSGLRLENQEQVFRSPSSHSDEHNQGEGKKNRVVFCGICMQKERGKRGVKSQKRESNAWGRRVGPGRPWGASGPRNPAARAVQASPRLSRLAGGAQVALALRNERTVPREAVPCPARASPTAGFSLFLSIWAMGA